MRYHSKMLSTGLAWTKCPTHGRLNQAPVVERRAHVVERRAQVPGGELGPHRYPRRVVV